MEHDQVDKIKGSVAQTIKETKPETEKIEVIEILSDEVCKHSQNHLQT